jgi:hypothetical protein
VWRQRRRPVPLVVAGASSLMNGAPLAGAAAAPRGRQVQQPPLLLRLLPLPVLPRLGERRVHWKGVVGGDEVLEGPRDRLDGVVATLDVRKHIFEGAARCTPASTVAGGAVARGRRCDKDDDRPFSTTSRGHQACGNFPRCFPRFCFLWTPRARPGGPGMTWARRMDESPNPGAQLGHFSPSG